ncbi:lipoprotein [Streptomyces sp. NPDC048506]|uniref:lipoprotein n=1 Tax=Streptomyces sp. NPDC048506 TaxID=3155028 RepID=UPI003443822C
MRSRVRRPASWVLGAALLAGAALGCAREERVSVEVVGGPHSVCKLPVTFEVDKPWKTNPAEQPLPPEMKRSFHFSRACDLDLKVGKEKVALWVDVDDLKGTNPRKVLGDHDGVGLAGYGEYQYSSPESISTSTVAGRPAAEMAYETKPPDDIPHEQIRKLTVVTPKGTIVLCVASKDPGGQERTRQVYERAKSSLRIVS